ARRRQRTEIAVAELVPDRAADILEVLPRMYVDRLDPGSAQDRVVAVPAEHPIRKEVEVLVDAEASAREDFAQRDVVTLVRVPGQQVLLNRSGQLTGCGPVAR